MEIAKKYIGLTKKIYTAYKEALEIKDLKPTDKAKLFPYQVQIIREYSDGSDITFAVTIDVGAKNEPTKIYVWFYVNHHPKYLYTEKENYNTDNIRYKLAPEQMMQDKDFLQFVKHKEKTLARMYVNFGYHDFASRHKYLNEVIEYEAEAEFNTRTSTWNKYIRPNKDELSRWKLYKSKKNLDILYAMTKKAIKYT